MLSRRNFLFLGAAALLPAQAVLAGSASWPKNPEWVNGLLHHARQQIGVTLLYDPTYTALAYPMGDVERAKGVCTDVIIRAYRDAFRFDLQQAVHEDMRKDFAVYPKTWGLKRPDPNIDHRRVPNLRVWLARQSAGLPVSSDPADYQPGDIVTQLINKRLPHIGIVSDQRVGRTKTPLLIHNIGYGTQEDDSLFQHGITGHYRFAPKGIAV